MSNDNSCPSAGPGNYPSDCDLTGALLEKARARNTPIARGDAWKSVLPKASRIKLLLLDVDGVLTDGTFTYTPDGEAKRFNTRDGFGLRILQEAGIEAGVITARSSEAVRRRAADLKLAHVYQGRDKKLEVYEEILRKTGLRPPQIAYMGDDWLDAPLLNRVGLALAPANAVAEIKQRVDYVTSAAGGHGAVREVCDLIIEATGNRENLIRSYL